MFEREGDRLAALHHPFTSPHQDDVVAGLPLEQCRAHAFDLVYNGVEAGGGSLRIHRCDIYVEGYGRMTFFFVRVP